MEEVECKYGGGTTGKVNTTKEWADGWKNCGGYPEPEEGWRTINDWWPK